MSGTDKELLEHLVWRAIRSMGTNSKRLSLVAEGDRAGDSCNYMYDFDKQISKVSIEKEM